MHEYDAADLKRLFNLTAPLIRALERAGYVTMASPEGTTGYSFQDLLVLRMASALKSAKISTPRIVAALGKIRAALPPGSVLATFALSASGHDRMVRERIQTWKASSGQYALPLASGGDLTALPAERRPLKRPALLMEAEKHYSRGHALEASDVTAARAAYLDALNAHSGHLQARINLGRILHLAGELKEAEQVYRQARTSSALLSFNLAILLEDLNREDEAIVAYREALAQDPHMFDAHFNLSRLHERARQPREALRHLLAYRRHIARHDA